MITITSKAHQVVRQVTSHPRVGPHSGLRIAAQDDETAALSVRTVAEPQPGDRVLESDGARLYLDDVAEPRVDGHVLDAVTEDSGRVHFVVKD
jgi:Fe-S cluster assembly iron-binding protein IscA